MTTVDVDCDEIRRIKARLKEVNAIPFEDIRWMHKGQPVTVDTKEREDWIFLGFNNADFVRYVIDKDIEP